MFPEIVDNCHKVNVSSIILQRFYKVKYSKTERILRARNRTGPEWKPITDLPSAFRIDSKSSDAQASYSEFGNHVQRCDRHLLREHCAILQWRSAFLSSASSLNFGRIEEMAKEDKRREAGRGARPQRNEKGGAGNGRMAEYSSRTSTPSVAGTLGV